MKKIVFIGGPADGRRHDFEGVPPSYVRIPHMGGPTDDLSNADPARMPEAMLATEYWRTGLRGPTGEFFVYHAGDGDVIEQLINGYRTP